MEIYSKHIAAVNDKLHAVIEIDLAGALAIAETLDRKRTVERIRGPLYGIPILVKDNYATADGDNDSSSSSSEDPFRERLSGRELTAQCGRHGDRQAPRRQCQRLGKDEPGRVLGRPEAPRPTGPESARRATYGAYARGQTVWGSWLERQRCRRWIRFGGRGAGAGDRRQYHLPRFLWLRSAVAGRGLLDRGLPLTNLFHLSICSSICFFSFVTFLLFKESSKYTNSCSLMVRQVGSCPGWSWGNCACRKD